MDGRGWIRGRPRGDGGGVGFDTVSHELMEGGGTGVAPHEPSEGSGSGAVPHGPMEGSGPIAVPLETRETSPLPRSRGQA